jgi:hypothetical protein
MAGSFAPAVRRVLAAAAIAAIGAVWPGWPTTRAVQAPSIPQRLTDQEFWRLSSDLSEPNGYFRSDNLVSNEHTYQYVIPDLQKVARPGGVYLGVAPDQNFTYIVATRPGMAFIVDVRRGNLLEHLMYKAVIELSADRAAFLSRLLSKPRPAGLGARSTVAELLAAFDRAEAREDLYRQNLQALKDQLVKRHGFALSPDDLAQIEQIYFAFFWEGPGLRYSMSNGFGGRFRASFPSYGELIAATDSAGRPCSYLASEERFRTLKTLEEGNLIVPVVGNFAGPKALRAVGDYVRARGSTISTFYVSNVEQYLFQDGLFEAFARNVATLPVDEGSTFVRSVSVRFGYAGAQALGPDGRATALYPIRAFVQDFLSGRLSSYYEVNFRSR